jgi:hypothetical protein
LLICAVPTWFYVSGWNGGQGERREAVAVIKLNGKGFRLWRQKPDDGSIRWCAEPLDRSNANGDLAFGFLADTLDAEFDAGLQCATAPRSDQTMPQLQSRKLDKRMSGSEPRHAGIPVSD